MQPHQVTRIKRSTSIKLLALLFIFWVPLRRRNSKEKQLLFENNNQRKGRGNFFDKNERQSHDAKDSNRQNEDEAFAGLETAAVAAPVEEQQSRI